MTEWKLVRMPDWSVLKELMVGNVVVDGRNINDENEFKELGLNYYRIGKRIE